MKIYLNGLPERKEEKFIIRCEKCGYEEQAKKVNSIPECGECPQCSAGFFVGRYIGEINDN